MRREITIYIRFADSETAASLEDLADSCYIALDEIRLLEPHQGYTPHCVIAQGEEAQITAFTEAAPAGRWVRARPLISCCTRGWRARYPSTP